ncbi:MAG TPA: DUF4019 domain-containing protein [Ramlibacter sp.]|nr:DUF4019 domain-containing protein [Ramlibacter sp.]
MKFSCHWLLPIAAVLYTTTAAAQLKPPRAATPAATPAASAAAPAAVPANNANAEKEAAGKLAAAGWLVLLDRRDWGTAWETASAVFRNSVPLPTWMDGIPKVREPFGAFIERAAADSVYKTTLEGRPQGEYVSVIFTSKFEKKELQEVITTVREPDGKWRVTGYSTR